MPGLKLDFLKNTTQRLGTGKSLPLKQVEAAVVYGTNDQRAKVIEKLIPSVFNLSLHQSTHHIVLTLLEHCDNSIRVKILFQIRKKLQDLACSPVGNIVIQQLIEKVPSRQKREIAECYTINCDSDDFKSLCLHPFGNRVAQKLMEFSDSSDVLEEKIVALIPQIFSHQHGTRVVARFIDSTENGWESVVKALFPQALLSNKKDELDQAVSRIFSASNESMTLCALIRHPLVPTILKDAICAHLCEYAAEYIDPSLRKKTDTKSSPEEDFPAPDFGNASKHPKLNQSTSSDGIRHLFTIAAMLEFGDNAQRQELWSSLQSVCSLIATNKSLVPVAVAALRFYPESHKSLYDSLTQNPPPLKGKMAIKNIALDPVRSLGLRAAIEVDRNIVYRSDRIILADSAVALSQSPVSSPVLQKLLESDPDGESSSRMYERLKDRLDTLIQHNSASFLVQGLLQYMPKDEKHADFCRRVLEVFKDFRLSISTPQGSRVMQKLLNYSSDDIVSAIADKLLEKSAEANSEVEAATDDLENNSGDADEESNTTKAPQNGKESQKTTDSPDGKEPLSDQTAGDKENKNLIPSNRIISFALHNHACYFIKALFLECTNRGLTEKRKLITDELKPYVFDLATSPCAGRIVFDTMLQCVSKQLSDAMRNVVFLRVESWLSTLSDKRKEMDQKLGDTSIRRVLKRGREEETNDPRNQDESGEANTTKTTKRRKTYRSIKR